MGNGEFLATTESASFRVPYVFRHVWRSLILIYIPILGLAGFFSYHIYWNIFESNYQPYFESQQSRLDNAVNTFSRELGHIHQLIRLLRYNQQFEKALQAGMSIDYQSLENVFTDFSNASSHISQLRWLDEKGVEKLRMNISDKGVIKVAPEALQNKSKRQYVKTGMRLEPDEVYISAINPNIENGQIVLPLEKTIRAVMRTGKQDGLHDGVLVINFLLNDMFESLNQKQDNKLRIIDNEGYWVMHPNPSMAFRSYTDYLVRTERLLSQAVIKGILDQRQLHNFIHGSRLISYSVIDIGENGPDNRHRLFFIDSSAPDLLGSLKYRVALIVFIPTVLVLVVLLFLIGRFLYDGRKQYDLFRQLAVEKEALAKSNQQLQLAYEQQQQMQDTLVELRKLSSMAMMVAGLAHELNTPLGGAALTLSSLDSSREQLQQAVSDGLRKSELEDYLTHSAETIALARKNIAKAAELVKSFKRLAVDRHTDESTEFDLMTVINDVATTSKHRLKQQHIHLDIVGPKQLVIQSYAGIISQLFENLISNAISHGFAGRDNGHIHIEVIQTSMNDISVSVSDDGHGIDVEQLTTIFDPFVTGARGAGHTGLGLHLCHQWVTQVLKGSISVSSEPGQGTTFIVLLPVDVDSSSQS